MVTIRYFGVDCVTVIIGITAFSIVLLRRENLGRGYSSVKGREMSHPCGTALKALGSVGFRV